MPVLKNPKHERFAQELAKGKTQVDGYETAGYIPNDGNAAKLAARPEIQDRVREITGKAAEKVGITKERVLSELGKIGFSNMMDYIRIGDDGLPVTDFSSLTRDQAAAIQEVNVETAVVYETGEGDERQPVNVRKVRFKIADKRGALVDIGKELGMFKERVEHSGTVTLADLVGGSMVKDKP